MHVSTNEVPLTVADVSKWLKELNCGQYAEKFASYEIDGEKLLWMINEVDLGRELEVHDQIHREFLLSEINKLRYSQGAETRLELSEMKGQPEHKKYQFYQILHPTPVLDSQYLDSNVIAQLVPGTIVVGGQVKNTRLNLIYPIEGWINLTERITGGAIASKIATRPNTVFKTTQKVTQLLASPNDDAEVEVVLNQNVKVVVLESQELWFRVQASESYEEEWTPQSGWVCMFKNGKAQLQLATRRAPSNPRVVQPKPQKASDRRFGVSGQLSKHVRVSTGCSFIAIVFMTIALSVPYWFAIEVHNDLDHGYQKLNRHWGLWQVCENSEDAQINTCFSLEDDRDSRYRDNAEVRGRVDTVRFFSVASVVIASMSWLMVLWPKRYADWNIFSLFGALFSIASWGTWGASNGSANESGAIWGKSNSWCNMTAAMACSDSPDGCELTPENWAFTRCEAAIAWGYVMFIFGTSLLLLTYGYVLFRAPNRAQQGEKHGGNLKHSTHRVSGGLSSALARRLAYQPMHKQGCIERICSCL